MNMMVLNALVSFKPMIGQNPAFNLQRQDINILLSTGRYWFKQREQLGSPAARRIRKLANRLERRSVRSDLDLDTLLNRNDLIHWQLYDEQGKNPE
jgi:hypothetical protein